MSTKPVLLINGNPVGDIGGEGGSGGHTIIDSSGSSLTQESGLQFTDAFVEDDPTNGRTVVENVKEVASADYSSETEDGMYLITDGEGAVIEPASDDKVEVTADGVKTVATLLSELYAEIDFDKVTDTAYLSISDGTVFALTRRLTNELRFGASHTTGTDRVVTLAIRIKELSSDCQFTQNTAQSNGNTIASNNAYQYPNGTVIALHYGNKKATVDLQTTANRCWYDSSNTVKQKLDSLPFELVETTGTTDSSGYFNLGANAKIIACVPKDYNSACRITDILVNQWDITYVVTDQPSTNLTLLCIKIKS